jgi:hypothetical protein
MTIQPIDGKPFNRGGGLNHSTLKGSGHQPNARINPRRASGTQDTPTARMLLRANKRARSKDLSLMSHSEKIGYDFR